MNLKPSIQSVRLIRTPLTSDFRLVRHYLLDTLH